MVKKLITARLMNIVKYSIKISYLLFSFLIFSCTKSIFSLIKWVEKRKKVATPEIAKINDTINTSSGKSA